MDPLVLDIQRHFDDDSNKFNFVNDLLYFQERLYISEGHIYL